MRLVLLILLTSVQVVTAGTYYVSPNGSDDSVSGGTFANPGTLTNAVNVVGVGWALNLDTGSHTVVLKEGTYNTFTWCNFAKSAQDGQRLTYKASGRARIASAIRVSGARITLWGIETYMPAEYYPNPNETRAEQDAKINVSYRLGTVEFEGASCEAINCIFHDMYQSIGWSTGATDSTLNGCVIYNIGRAASDLNSGHGLYAQNSTGTKTLKNCIVAFSALDGLNFYSGGATDVKNITVNGSAVYGCGFGTPITSHNLIVSAGNTPDNIIITNSAFLDTFADASSAKVARQGNNPNAIQLRDNLFYSAQTAFSGSGMANCVVTGNDFRAALGMVDYSWKQNNETWDLNHYVGNMSGGVTFNYDGVYKSFSDWKSLSEFDANSTYVNAAPSTLGTETMVWAIDNDGPRAHVAVANYAGSHNVVVAMPATFSTNATVTVRCGHSYWDASATLALSGRNLTLPLTNWPLAIFPSAPAKATNTLPMIGAFVVQQIGGTTRSSFLRVGNLKGR